METDSEPPSMMNLADLTEMALNQPDSKAANLCIIPAQETIALPVTTFSAADSPCENNSIFDYHADVQKRIGSLLEFGLYTDVTFLAGEYSTPVKAHKLILSMASPVFASMFNGSMKSENEVTIPDIKPEPFNILLHYVYKNEVREMSLEECLDVLYIARKYNIRGLEDACHISLCNRVNEENVFDILNACNFYDLSGLSIICWEYIEEHASKVLTHHMPEIETKTLITIMENDQLNIREVDLFLLFHKWVENKCALQELEPTPENKRVVSNFLLKLVRFPTMSSTEFADNVVPTGMLTMDEMANIFTFITASPGRKPATEFSTIFRIPRITRGTLSPNDPNAQPGMACVFEYSPQSILSNSRRRMASASRRRRH